MEIRRARLAADDAIAARLRSFDRSRSGDREPASGTGGHAGGRVSRQGGVPLQVRQLHRVAERELRARKLRPGDPIAGLHVLFIGGSDTGRLAEILAAARGRALLTVTESEGGLELGSMINFVVVEDKVRFDVAPPPPESGNLKISARLLGVARKVVSKSS